MEMLSGEIEARSSWSGRRSSGTGRMVEGMISDSQLGGRDYWSIGA